MKKLLILLSMVVIYPRVFAEHTFKVCYINQSTNKVAYINNGISRKWKSRGELLGSGHVAPGEVKCFGNIKDETIFTSDIITFYAHNKWYGIVNPGFASPYVIAQDATNSKGGKLKDNTVNGKDNYSLYITVLENGSAILSNSQNYKDEDSIIEPRRFFGS